MTRANYVSGAGRKLPDSNKKKRCIVALNTNSREGSLIEDNLCAFRCLAYHRKRSRKGLERPTLGYFREYVGERVSKIKFQGLCLKDVPIFESTFDTNVNIF